jgi:hypothetical protein
MTIKINYKTNFLMYAFHVAGVFIPAAKNKAYKLEAQDSFGYACEMLKYTATDPMAEKLAQSFLKDAKAGLKDAGEDIDSDKPYVEILHLTGGKKEFDALLPQ